MARTSVARPAPPPLSATFKLAVALTLETWINVTTFSPGIILMRGDNRGGLDPYGLSVNPDGKVYFFMDNAANEQAYLTAALPVGQWKHVAGTFDASTG